MTTDEARDLLESELTQRLTPGDRVSVTAQLFEDFTPTAGFIDDPVPIKKALVIRLWRYIDSRKYMQLLSVAPELVDDRPVLSMVIPRLISDWNRNAAEAERGSDVSP